MTKDLRGNGRAGRSKTVEASELLQKSLTAVMLRERCKG